MSNTFWDHIAEYVQLGFDPLLWLAQSSNDIDYKAKLTAASGIRKTGLKISPSWFDAYYYIDGKEPVVTRRVLEVPEATGQKEVDVKRALALFRLKQEACEDPVRLADILESFFKPFQTKLSISCLSISATAHENAQFGLLDYIELHRGDKVGYMPAVNAVTQATDILAMPDAEVHSSIAVTTCIDVLNILGCGLASSLRIFPIYDAPNEEILDRIRANLDTFASRYNLAWEDYSSLKRGSLFFGSTAMATTTKELPTKYDQVEEGMEIMLTNKMGGLPALALKILSAMNPDNLSKFENDGVDPAHIDAASQVAIKNLSEPHFALGKIISKYCPDFGLPIDKSSNIVAVLPVGSRGVSAFAYMAELVSCQLVINELPLIDPALSAYIAKEALVGDATASLNGCHIIIASKDALNLIEAELQKHNFAPLKIGFVGKKGTPSVAIDRQVIDKLVPSGRKLSALIGPSYNAASAAASTNPPA